MDRAPQGGTVGGTEAVAPRRPAPVEQPVVVVVEVVEVEVVPLLGAVPP